MSDGKKSCLGFVFLIAAMALAVLALFSGGLGSLITWLGGQSFGLDLRTGTILGVGAFVFFFVLAVYMFIQVKEYSWFPAILSGAYAVLPDIFLGPEDDIVVLILGAVISGLLVWRKERAGKLLK
ncbi:MAG: hypothetical protein OEZ02_11325 [Anaerolineae bacterium]|nr:hypothetical protein [Anaerolineae bacterium]